MKLNDCPFCGSSEVGVVKEHHRHKYVYCRNCGATGPVNTKQSEAEKAWNSPLDKE